MKAAIRKFLLALAYKAIAKSHKIIVAEQKALESEAEALYKAATYAFEMAAQKSKDSLAHKFHAQDVERAKHE